MKIFTGILTAAAGALALAAAHAYPEPPPPPPACMCQVVSDNLTGCSLINLGTLTNITIGCTVTNNTTCSITGSISWAPAAQQTCTWGSAFWGPPGNVPMNPAIAQGPFFPSSTNNCVSPPGPSIVTTWLNIVGGGPNPCWLYCRRDYNCTF